VETTHSPGIGAAPPIVLGSVAFNNGADESVARELLARCLDNGLNWIDTAPSYNDGASETAVGRALAALGRRSDVVLATKFGLSLPAADATPEAISASIVAEVEGSLRRLGTDHVDLLQLHRPWFGVPAEDVLRPLAALVQQGKVRSIGSSNFPSWLLADFARTSAALDLPVLTLQQSPYNLLDRRIENELIPYCRLHDFMLMTWSPTASGLLSGRYVHGAPPPDGSRATWVAGFERRLTERNLAVVAELGAAAAAVGLTTPQLALAWTLAQPGVAGVIIGPRTPAHLDDALYVLRRDGELPEAALIDAIVAPGGCVIDLATLSRPSSYPSPPRSSACSTLPVA
jgi:1-deoxyxylulose-5-phosphate synthase